jgi:hypothetical protein
MTYKLINPIDSPPGSTILRKTDNVQIPKDEANSDYQEYLEWVAAGNTPEAAD